MPRPRLLWLLYAAFIIYGGTIPFHFSGSLDDAWVRLRELPLSPFVSPDTGRRISIPDAVQNVLLFLPFGALGYWARRHRGGGRRKGARAVAAIPIVTALGFGLSVWVEALQLLTNDRVASAADVAANTAGAFAGAVAAWVGYGAARSGLRRLEREGLVVRELHPLAVSSVVLAIAFLQPFDVTLEVGAVSSDIRMLERDLIQFTGLRDEGIVIILCAFFSATLASYLSVLGERRAGTVAFTVGAVAVFLLEGSQLLIGSRTPSLWDLGVGWTGLGVGLALWRLTPRIPSERAWLVILGSVTFLAAAMQMLSPFEIAPEYRPMSLYPFRGYYTRTTFETLSHVIELALLYVPLGFFAGTSAGVPDRTGGGSGHQLLRLLLITVVLAGVVEYLQGWVVGRYSDVSDVGLCLIGALAGWWASRAGPGL